jgi:hypothetical protein
MKIDQLLIFFYFQVNGDLKYTYVFSNCTYYSHNISKFLCKNYFEHCIDWLVSKLLFFYFIIQNLWNFLFNLPQTQWTSWWFYVSFYESFWSTLLCVCQKSNSWITNFTNNKIKNSKNIYNLPLDLKTIWQSKTPCNLISTLCSF